MGAHLGSLFHAHSLVRTGPKCVSTALVNCTTNVIVLASVSWKFLFSHPISLSFATIYRKYHVRVTEETLSYGYSHGCASRTVDRAQIETIEKVPLIKPVFDWGGWFIRKHFPSFDTGYIPKKGPGLRITFRLEDGKELCDTFLCDDPDAVINLLSGSEPEV
jgi:hypothetical protein